MSLGQTIGQTIVSVICYNQLTREKLGRYIWREGYQIWHLATNEYSNATSARDMFQPTDEFGAIWRESY